MLKIPDDLNGAVALNICRTRDGWQASLEKSPGSFSIHAGATPSEAVELAFGSRPLDVAPCPVPVCPVPAP
jgi:hypothetical protein